MYKCAKLRRAFSTGTEYASLMLKQYPQPVGWIISQTHPCSINQCSQLFSAPIPSGTKKTVCTPPTLHSNYKLYNLSKEYTSTRKNYCATPCFGNNEHHIVYSKAGDQILKLAYLSSKSFLKFYSVLK